jgi:hypothetical protein
LNKRPYDAKAMPAAMYAEGENDKTKKHKRVSEGNEKDVDDVFALPTVSTHKNDVKTFKVLSILMKICS